MESNVSGRSTHRGKSKIPFIFYFSLSSGEMKQLKHTQAATQPQVGDE